MSANLPSEAYFKKIFQPLLVLIITIFIAAYWSPLLRLAGITISERGMQLSFYFFQTALWLISTWLLIGIIDIAVWKVLFRNRLKILVPKLIKDSVKIILFFTAILCISTNVFSASITGFLAASGLIGLIVGFAVRNLIADLFNGLALNFDHPFARGELLQLNIPGLPGVLKVVDTTWRTTRFETENNDLLIIPNSKLGTMVITNLSKKLRGNFDLMVNVAAEIPTEKVIATLDAALKSTPGVLALPEPKVRIHGLKNNAVSYKLSYSIELQKTSPPEIKHVISSRILQYFAEAGLTLHEEIFRPLSLNKDI